VEKSAFQPSPPKRSLRRITLAAILFAATISTPAHPQGCTQCLDNTAATPPKTQAAYRHAIILLTLTATGLFAATLIIFKRYR
jgi:serine protease inhibitor ecotin